MAKPSPQLPSGTSSILRGLSETFSFHASPESFITSRIIDFQKEHPDLIDSRSVVRAKILNRDVAVVSSYLQVKQVLKDDCTSYEASGAYNELMAPFFPSPNLLLTDGFEHSTMRRLWEERVAPVGAKFSSFVIDQTKAHFDAISASPEIDLYESLKTLSWKLLLGIFLDLNPKDELYATVESLQETLMRGQFSLFPISINAGFWHSPRKRGIDAKTKLQALILKHLKSNEKASPFLGVDDNDALEDLANHTLLITSSLAVKALASLLTAFLLNLYVYRDSSGQTLVQNLSQYGAEESSSRLRSILLETERLSPPIVGIMRRSIQDNLINSPDEQADVMVPKGWDCWLYFVGSGRDPTMFGSTWDQFDPGRYTDSSTPEAMAFSTGPKTCLGQNMIRDIALAVANACIASKLQLRADVTARGVRGWLGWDSNDSVKPEDWIADMKQLPVQRPINPVIVQLSHKEL